MNKGFSSHWNTSIFRVPLYQKGRKRLFYSMQCNTSLFLLVKLKRILACEENVLTSQNTLRPFIVKCCQSRMLLDSPWLHSRQCGFLESFDASLEGRHS